MPKHNIGMMLINPKKFRFSDISNLVKTALSKKLDMLVFPEDYPKSLSDDEFNQLKTISKNKKILFLVTKRGKEHSSYLISPKKTYKILKVSNFGLDKKKFHPGKSFSVFSLNGLKFAVLICYDLYFSEYISLLKKERLDFLVVLSSVPKGRGEFWRNLVKIRSSEMQLPVVSSAISSETDLPANFLALPSFSLQAPNPSRSFFIFNFKKNRPLESSPLVRGRVLLKQKNYGPFIGDFVPKTKIKRMQIFI